MKDLAPNVSIPTQRRDARAGKDLDERQSAQPISKSSGIALAQLSQR